MLDVKPDGSPYLALFDSNGVSRLTLYLAPDGSPALGFFDKLGKERIGLGLSKGSPMLNLFDHGGKERVSLAAVTGGPAGLMLKNADEKGRLRLSTGPGDEASLRILGTDEKTRIGLGQGPEQGLMGLNEWDERGRHRAGLGITPHGETEFTRAGSDGALLFRVTPNGAQARPRE